MNELEETAYILFKWCNSNYMKVNSDKSPLLMSGKEVILKIDDNHIKSENTHDLLGITTDLKLTFENHINKLSKKASQKTNALLEYLFI